MNNDEGFLPYQLYHHFGGHLPDQETALHAWTSHLLNRTPMTPEQLVEAFKNDAFVPQPIEIELPEARQLLQHGESIGAFIKSQGSSYSLSDKEKLRLHTQMEQGRRDEEHAQTALRYRLMDLYPALSNTAVIQELWVGLRQFTKLVVLDYVRRTAALDNRLRAVELIQEVFPPEHALNQVATNIFPAFLQDTVEGKRLFASALSAAIYAFRTTISERGAQTVQDKLSNRKLYLDTNVLISALGLRGDPGFEESTRRLLTLAESEGFLLLYTNATESEYCEAIDSLGKRLGSSASYDYEPEYMYRRRSSSLDRAFLLQRGDRTPKEFVEYWRDLPDRLGELTTLKIKPAYISELDYEHIAKSTEYERAYAALGSIDYSNAQRVHDAKNLALVLYERRGIETFSKTPSWFITHHASLHRMNRSLDLRYPAALTVDAWVLHFRRFLTRVDDFDTFLVDMISNNVLSGFRLPDRDIAVASQYLEKAIERDAGEVISGVFQRVPNIAISKAVESADSSEHLVDLLLKHDADMHRSLMNHTNQHVDVQMRQKDETIAKQESMLSAESKNRQAMQEERDRAIQQSMSQMRAYQNSRDNRDVVNRSIQTIDEQLRDLKAVLDKRTSQKLTTQIAGTMMCALLLIFVIFFPRIGLSPNIRNGVEVASLWGLTPIALLTGLWFLIGTLWRAPINEVTSALEQKTQERVERVTECDRLSDEADALARSLGLD